MTPERWAEVDRLWHAVLARPEAERAAAVVELCASDAELRQEVERLLANRDRASVAGFGAAPANHGIQDARGIGRANRYGAHDRILPALLGLHG